MPYYVHEDGQEPETGLDFDTRQLAHEESTRPSLVKRVITFAISEDERNDWRRREYQRFKDGVYGLPPWIDELSYTWSPWDTEASNAIPLYRTVFTHFAHTSLKTPGAIAYTESDEKGYQDKQTVIKVGRYLERYLSDVLTREEIAAYVDTVKSYSKDLQITRNPDEIVSIYVNGPRSCMSRKASAYQGDVHPAYVYGNSPDLAVAYMGTVDKPTARCIVWPDRSEYTRVFGDSTLTQILHANGYTVRNGSGYGDLDGARIVAREHERGIYVMPYIDAAESASLSDCGKYLVLHRSCGGDYETHVTQDYNGDTLCAGLTENVRRNTCENCNETIDEDETYCSSCDDNHWSCESCGRESFDSCDQYSAGHRTLCEDCYNEAQSTCESCGDTWCEEDLSRHNRLRDGDPLRSYCVGCRDLLTVCADCSDVFDVNEHSNDPDHDRCDDCCTDPDEDEDATEDEDESPALLPETVHPLNLYPTIANEITIPIRSGDRAIVHVLHRVGAIAVHEAYNQKPHELPFKVTHVLTGLFVIECNTLIEAMHRADALAKPGIDWNFTDAIVAPSATRAWARTVSEMRYVDLYAVVTEGAQEQAVQCA